MNTTKQVLQQYYACFNQKDSVGLLALLAEDVIHDLNQGERQVGKAAFARFMGQMQAYDEQIDDLSLLVSEDGTRASAEFMVTGRYVSTDASGRFPAASGQVYHIACGSFFELKKDKIQRVSVHYNVNEWLKQIGG